MGAFGTGENRNQGEEKQNQLSQGTAGWRGACSALISWVKPRLKLDLPGLWLWEPDSPRLRRCSCIALNRAAAVCDGRSVDPTQEIVPAFRPG